MPLLHISAAPLLGSFCEALFSGWKEAEKRRSKEETQVEGGTGAGAGAGGGLIQADVAGGSSHPASFHHSWQDSERTWLLLRRSPEEALVLHTNWPSLRTRHPLPPTATIPYSEKARSCRGGSLPWQPSLPVLGKLSIRAVARKIPLLNFQRRPGRGGRGITKVSGIVWLKMGSFPG